jgi:hypothetical protein
MFSQAGALVILRIARPHRHLAASDNTGGVRWSPYNDAQRRHLPTPLTSISAASASWSLMTSTGWALPEPGYEAEVAVSLSP